MLAPWKESYDKDTALPTQVHTVKDMVFPVVMYGCERWSIKKADCGGFILIFGKTNTVM